MTKKRKPAAAKADTVMFEATLKAASNQSMFAPGAMMTPDTIEQYKPASGSHAQAAAALRKVGFTIRHVGAYSISGEGPRTIWESVFSTKVEERSQPLNEAHPDAGEVTFLSHISGTPFTIPDELSSFVERAYPQLPPTFFQSPSPPRVKYHYLNVPADVSMICRSPAVHRDGVRGKGILVAMPDTGFYKHPFYQWHGYNYHATLSPDTLYIDQDEYGHGTAEAANIFANAPEIDFIGVKMGVSGNPTLAFKIASDLHPAVMTNSWGYSIPGNTLPNFLKPLEAAVIEAVRVRGITVCFSAGNGHFGFPAQMPEVIAVGGVFVHEGLANGDFDMEASSYASSFDSQIYPGRHVPDVCGLVGMPPRAAYIMLPTQPSCTIDTSLAGGAYPNADETKPNDGWTVISGTSAASPQVAGVCALLKQVQPGLSPDLMKAILRASARQVKKGKSAMGQLAGEDYHGATGAGLVDAYEAYKLARSSTPRPLFELPAPR